MKTDKQSFYNRVSSVSEITLAQLIHCAGSYQNLLEYLDDAMFELCLIQETVDGEPDEENGVWDGSIVVVDNHFEYVGFDGPCGGSGTRSVRIERSSKFMVC